MSEPNQDDDAWLYGDKAEEAQESAGGDADTGEETRKSQLSIDAVPFESQYTTETVAPTTLPVLDREAGELSGEEADKAATAALQDDDEDDDDSDDDVQVTIGDIKAAPPTQYGFGAHGKRPSQTYQQKQTETSQTPGKPTVVIQQPQKAGIDLDAVGTINGISIYDFDLETLAEEKPWNKPGADITDYFNYGFNEETWMKYCQKQRQLRQENLMTNTIQVVNGKDSSIPVGGGVTTTTAVNQNSKYSSSVNKAVVTGPQKSDFSSFRKPTSGQIQVLSASRRVSESSDTSSTGVISVIGGSRSRTGPPPSGAPPQGPPSMHPPPIGQPPPGYPIPPPDMMNPPPGMGQPMIPPHNFGPPPGTQGIPIPPNFAGYPPPGSGPPPDMQSYDHGYYPNAGYPSYTSAPPTSVPPPMWGEPGRDWDDSVSSYSESGRRSPSYDRYRDDRDRKSADRERDRRHRERERERERDRDRDRDKDKEKDRDRERDDRHKKKKRNHDEEDEHRSKHHKRKKSKREKDDEGTDE